MVCQRFTLPVVSVVDATINEIKKNGYKRVLVFGTVFTLKSGRYDNLNTTLIHIEEIYKRANN